MSVNSTSVFRGISIIFIVLHHISQYMDAGNFVSHFIANYPGRMFTGVFLFFSGYGNFVSFSKLNNATGREKTTWFLKRIFRIIADFVFVFILGVAAEFATSSNYPVSSMVKDLFTLALPGYVNWYIKMQLVFYLLFFIVFFIPKLNNKIKTAILTMITIAIVLLFRFGLHTNQYWYDSLICFPLGVVIALISNDIMPIVKKHSILISIFTGVVVVATIVMVQKGFCSEINIILTLAFSLFVMTLTSLFSFKSRVLSFIGGISFEVYLVHLVLIRILLMNTTTNDNIAIPIICVLSIGLSYVLNKPVNLLQKRLFSASK